MRFKSETSILATELGGQSRYQTNPLYLNRSKMYWLKKKKAWSPPYYKPAGGGRLILRLDRRTLSAGLDKWDVLYKPTDNPNPVWVPSQLCGPEPFT